MKHPPASPIEISIKIADRQGVLRPDKTMIRKAVRKVLRDAGRRKACISCSLSAQSSESKPLRPASSRPTTVQSRPPMSVKPTRMVQCPADFRNQST